MGETAGAATEAADIAEAPKSAARRMPGMVALVSTIDPEADQPVGLAASAVIAMSMGPPSMLMGPL